MGSPVVHVRLALNKLEKVALRYSRKYGRPPVLILNNVHYFNNDDEGRNMILQLQQRAEAWAASGELQICCSHSREFHCCSLGIMTMVFST
jgi:hypothetical protein